MFPLTPLQSWMFLLLLFIAIIALIVSMPTRGHAVTGKLPINDQRAKRSDHLDQHSCWERAPRIRHIRIAERRGRCSGRRPARGSHEKVYDWAESGL